MTTFDHREKNFENKFAHDGEIAFRVKARGHKLLGLWAAGKLGKSGPQAEEYAKALVLADFEHTGGGDIIARLLTDFAGGGIRLSEKELRVQLHHCTEEARAQIMEKE